jgi:peptide/nickel transport system substrate-binding protein
MRRLRLLGLAVVLVSLAVAAVSAQPKPVPVPAQPAQPTVKTLRLPLQTLSISLDPHLTQGSYSLGIIADVYEGLTQWSPGEPSALAPCLAKDWPKISADGLTYTFTLRTEAKFHNSACFENNKGRNLKASDVVASFKRLAACSAEEVNWFWLLKGWIVGLDEYADECQVNGGFAGADETEVEGLSAPDDATFVLKLKRPCASMLAILAHPCMSIVAAEGLNHFSSQLSSREVGTAPYRLQAVSEGEVYMLKRFEEYWGEKPYFERVTYGRSAGVPSLLSGDWASYKFTSSEYSRFVRDGKLSDSLKRANLELDDGDEEGINFVTFNMEDPIFGARDADGRGLRNAISLAINREQIITTLRGFLARPAGELLPPGCEFAEVTKSDDWAKFDLKQAKQALDATKYKGGIDPATGSALKLSVICDTSGESLCKVIKAGLSDLGIEVEQSLLDTAEFYAALDGGDGQLFFYGWNLDYPIGQNVFQLFDSRNIGSGADNRNVTRYNVKEFDESYAALQKLAMTPENQGKRKEITKKLSDLLLEDHAVLPLYIRRSPTLRSSLLEWPKVAQSAFDEARFIKAKK